MIRVIESIRSELGEGLYISGDKIYWLDILSKKLFIKAQNSISQYELPEQASAVLEVLESQVVLASESGVCVFDIENSIWSVKYKIPLAFKKSDYRANDGVKISRNKYLFGTMKKENPGQDGALWITNEHESVKVYESLGIPNSFIKISDCVYLISDSLLKLVYRFEFDVSFSKVKDVRTWLDLSDKSYTPDGGCIVDGFIYIAMWDGGFIHKYDLQGNFVLEINLPIKRPTNCKAYNTNNLIVTSAREQSVDSGKLFYIEL
ncbi:SMP-30/gluconolactonase/LRE family protein [Shewanella aquimarina]|uniref:SMP-30/gluconolactonase/LRE family protein n=1 Tax=Shewanella aquimarina TaxID=260365 RepID=UPI002014DA52|nr:SMP-30/gluconolactonase/LRE family protein [Shewanella aquimarina]MCL2910860.1 SMP-30/gluconolactonase/LRE family protein [Shewanella aquimarina]